MKLKTLIHFIVIFSGRNITDRNISTKYISVKPKQWIQIIVPIDSKYMFSKFSKPKFGKLYVFNAYARDSPEGQNIKMETGKYYREDHQILYYCAEGGEYSEGGMIYLVKKKLGENHLWMIFLHLVIIPLVCICKLNLE